MKAQSVGKGQDFGISSKIWLHAGKQSVQTTKEAERIGQNVITEPTSYHLAMTWLLSFIFL